MESVIIIYTHISKRNEDDSTRTKLNGSHYCQVQRLVNWQDILTNYMIKVCPIQDHKILIVWNIWIIWKRNIAYQSPSLFFFFFLNRVSTRNPKHTLYAGSTVQTPAETLSPLLFLCQGWQVSSTMLPIPRAMNYEGRQVKINSSIWREPGKGSIVPLFKSHYTVYKALARELPYRD